MKYHELAILKVLGVRSTNISLGQAALIAGIGLLVMVLCAPYAELYVMPRLVVSGDPEQTLQNFTDHRGLALSAFFGYLITFIADIIVAWALYVFLAPVHRQFSLLAAWMRVVYTVIALSGLVYLATVLLGPKAVDANEQLYSEVRYSLQNFNVAWTVGFFFFSLHLLLLGGLVLASHYVPKVIGLLVVIAGFGYLLDTLRAFLLPEWDTGFLMVTFFGELVFMVWLLGWGRKMPDLENA